MVAGTRDRQGRSAARQRPEDKASNFASIFSIHIISCTSHTQSARLLIFFFRECADGSTSLLHVFLFNQRSSTTSSFLRASSHTKLHAARGAVRAARAARALKNKLRTTGVSATVSGARTAKTARVHMNAMASIEPRP
mmetsp:Transcript_5499/g.14769  ORF Transcript_5499/g.14769 Transcript_5499/m.14769 type:complete len:138 (-) Transcript_5499:388-801(-)